MNRLPGFLLLTATCVLGLSGCDRMSFTNTDKALARAEQLRSSGDAQGAANAYERLLDGTAKTADVHFKLALLYDEKLGDAIGAIYHLHRYLNLAPKGVHAKEASANLARLEPILATSLEGGTLVSRAEALRLKTENADLKRQLAQRPAPALSSGINKSADAQQQKPAPGTRTYQVQPGDTMASISRKFYKTSARARDIQDANLNSAPDPKKLRAGQTLIIP